MLVFLAIMVAGFIILVGGSLFGHDHDGGLDHDADHGDHGHDAGHDNEPAASIFSPKVIGTFVMGFGGGGSLAQYAWGKVIVSSFVGSGVGLLMGLIMYFVLKLLYGQQATSLVETSSLIGKRGMVITEIGENSIGQVAIRVGAEAPTYLARSSSGKTITKGRLVQVVATSGSEVIVDAVQN
jgi:membrane-bound ClpP family serine protease